MNNFLLSRQHAWTDHGRMPLALPPNITQKIPVLQVGDLVLSSNFKLVPVKAIVTPAPAMTHAILISLMSDEGAGRALSLLCGMECLLLVKNEWVSASAIKSGDTCAALNAKGNSPQIATVHSISLCELRPAESASVIVDGDTGLFVNGVAVRCPE
jgi:hypothetical protein